MSFYIDEDALTEMVGDPDAPLNQKIQRLRAWLGNALRTTDEKGEPDPELVYKNGNYNMGENAIHIAMLAFKAKLKLNELKKEYRDKRNQVYTRIMTTKQKWVPSRDGESIMVDGDPDLSDVKERLDCQEDYIKFLEQMQELIRYYPRNADAMTRVHNFGREIGKIIVGVKDGR